MIYLPIAQKKIYQHSTSSMLLVCGLLNNFFKFDIKESKRVAKDKNTTLI
jgi:hypothetical protein